MLWAENYTMLLKYSKKNSAKNLKTKKMFIKEEIIILKVLYIATTKLIYRRLLARIN